jgi:hypothetical protein
LIFKDEGLARQVVELGYRGTGEKYSENDFVERKAILAHKRSLRGNKMYTFPACTDLDWKLKSINILVFYATRALCLVLKMLS